MPSPARPELEGYPSHGRAALWGVSSRMFMRLLPRLVWATALEAPERAAEDAAGGGRLRRYWMVTVTENKARFWRGIGNMGNRLNWEPAVAGERKLEH